jgi:hypothetical protein
MEFKDSSKVVSVAGLQSCVKLCAEYAIINADIGAITHLVAVAGLRQGSQGRLPCGSLRQVGPIKMIIWSQSWAQSYSPQNTVYVCAAVYIL